MLVIHQCVVLAVAGGAHTAPSGVGIELARGDVLDLECFGGLLCSGLVARAQAE